MLQQWRPRFFIREKKTQDLRCLIFLHFQAKIQHIIWQTCFAWMSFQTCCCMGHLPGCFNAPYFLLTRGQFSTPAVHDSGSCVSRAVPNWAKVIFFLVCRVMLAHYPGNLVIYHLCYLLHIIGIITMYKLYYTIITPLPTYLPRYLLHMKAGPTLPTSGDSNCFGSDPKLSKFFRSEALHRSSSVDPAGCFQEILFKQTGACHWKKFGSKCDAFGADMSSKTSAPETSCSKETVLRIGLMNHQRDCWARCNMC